MTFAAASLRLAFPVIVWGLHFGAVYALRYELLVARRDRWYVAGLRTTPPNPVTEDTR